jgi:hypothetical protein
MARVCEGCRRAAAQGTPIARRRGSSPTQRSERARPHVINLCDFMSLAHRLLTASRAGGVHEPPISTGMVPRPAV